MPLPLGRGEDQDGRHDVRADRQLISSQVDRVFKVRAAFANHNQQIEVRIGSRGAPGLRAIENDLLDQPRELFGQRLA